MIKDNLAQRKIIFNESVTSSVLEDVILYIIKWNKEDENIPVDKRQPIWLYLQSGGGSTFHGFSLIDVIKNSKTPVYGVCFAMCASMAFHIFLSCHKRYAFPNSILLMHEGEIGIQNCTSKAKETMDFLNTTEERVKNHVLERTTMDEDYYESVYSKEFYMYANKEGKEMGCVDYIIGEDISLMEIL